MHDACPEVALRADVDAPNRLLERVEDGSLDLALVYNPPRQSGLVCELLLEEKLVMVTNAAHRRFDPKQYVYVDWGPDFASNHRAAFPDHPNPPVTISFGPLALIYLLSVGGTGYFRAGTVAPFLQKGELFLVRGAPAFSHSAYAVYAAEYDGDVLSRARAGLRIVANQASIGPTQPIGARPRRSQSRRAAPSSASKAR
jgi:DNA-binding transcriptional LysR family regulator